MTNFEIIVNDAIVNGFISAEKVDDLLASDLDIPFHTFQEWRNMGYSVKKGEHALYVSRIWDKKFYKKIKEWRETHGENSDEEMPRPWKTNAYIFGYHQVQRLEKAEDVKMAKGEVSEKKTRKAKAVKTEEPAKAEKVAKAETKTAPKKAKAVKTTRKTKKADKPKTMKQKLAKAKAKEEAVASSSAPKVSMKDKWMNMEIGKPITVKIEKKAKATRKTETAKAETPKAEPKKTTRKADKYSKDYYVMTREGAKLVKGCPVDSKKIKGLFIRKEQFGKQTEFVMSDAKSGMFLKSDRKLKDLIAWLDNDDIVTLIKNARKGDNYKKYCERLQTAIANVKA